MADWNISGIIQAHPGMTVSEIADLYEENARTWERQPNKRNSRGETGTQIAANLREIAEQLRKRA